MEGNCLNSSLIMTRIRLSVVTTKLGTPDTTNKSCWGFHWDQACKIFGAVRRCKLKNWHIRGNLIRSMIRNWPVCTENPCTSTTSDQGYHRPVMMTSNSSSNNIYYCGYTNHWGTPEPHWRFILRAVMVRQEGPGWSLRVHRHCS